MDNIGVCVRSVPLLLCYSTVNLLCALPTELYTKRIGGMRAASGFPVTLLLAILAVIPSGKHVLFSN